MGLVLAGPLVISPVAVADTNCTLSGSLTIETPTETVSYQGQTYTLHSVGRIAPGESVTVTTADIDPGTYKIYAVVRGNETVRQRAELLDVSETVTLSVDGETGATATESDGGDTPATTAAPSTVSRTATPAPTATATSSGVTATGGPSPTPDTTTDGPEDCVVVIPPSTATERLAPLTEPSTTGGSGPGLTALTGLVVAAVTTIIATRRA